MVVGGSAAGRWDNLLADFSCPGWLPFRCFVVFLDESAYSFVGMVILIYFCCFLPGSETTEEMFFARVLVLGLALVWS